MSETLAERQPEPEAEAEDLRDRMTLLMSEYDELEIRLRKRGEPIRPTWAAAYTRCHDLIPKYQDFTLQMLQAHPTYEGRRKTTIHFVQNFKFALKELTRVVAACQAFQLENSAEHGPDYGPAFPVQIPDNQVFEGNGHLVEIRPADSAHDSAAQVLAKAKADPMFRNHEHHVEIMLNPDPTLGKIGELVSQQCKPLVVHQCMTAWLVDYLRTNPQPKTQPELLSAFKAQYPGCPWKVDNLFSNRQVPPLGALQYAIGLAKGETSPDREAALPGQKRWRQQQRIWDLEPGAGKRHKRRSAAPAARDAGEGCVDHDAAAAGGGGDRRKRKASNFKK